MLNRFLFLLLCAICFTGYVQAKDNQAFQIKNIEVNQTFDNIDQARDNALQSATKIGFKRLIKKLTNQSIRLSDYSDLDPAQYMLTYDIKNEKFSQKHYEAEFSIHFNPDMVRDFFKIHNIAYSEIQAESTLIIPVFNDAGKKSLWEEKTDWFKSWQDFSHHDQKMRVIIPNGDIHDLTKLTLEDIQTQNLFALRNIMKHYNATLVLVSELQPISDTQLIVKNTLYDVRQQIDQSSLDVNVTESMPKTYKDIQAYIVDELWQHAKQETLISDHREKTLTTDISIASLKNLVDLEKKLQSLNSINSYRINAVSSQNVNLTIYYIGSEDTLRNHIFDF